MPVLAGVDGDLLLLFLTNLVSNGRDHCLLKEDLRRHGPLVLNGPGSCIIPQPHRPVQVGLGDVALAEQVSEISHIALHQHLATLLPSLLLFLLHK